MQTVEQRREYIREYRAKNLHKIREIRRKSACKRRGVAFTPREEGTASIQSPYFKTYKNRGIQTPVGLCASCGRKYLVPLGCLFCKHTT